MIVPAYQEVTVLGKRQMFLCRDVLWLVSFLFCSNLMWTKSSGTMQRSGKWGSLETLDVATRTSQVVVDYAGAIWIWAKLRSVPLHLIKGMTHFSHALSRNCLSTVAFQEDLSWTSLFFLVMIMRKRTCDLSASLIKGNYQDSFIFVYTTLQGKPRERWTARGTVLCSRE